MFKMPFQRQKKTAKLARLNLQSENVYLRFPLYDDYKVWAKLRMESRNFLQPFEPTWPKDALTKEYYKSYLHYQMENRNKGQNYVFFIFEKCSDELIGGISLSNIRRGVVQNGQIGYWCGERFSKRGFMTESLQIVLDFAFQHLKLHRLEAASIPLNLRSIRLLEKNGFQQEGLLKSYVKINGTWQDHFLYALLKTEWQTKTQESQL